MEMTHNFFNDPAEFSIQDDRVIPMDSGD